jgi:hypothetical protein
MLQMPWLYYLSLAYAMLTRAIIRRTLCAHKVTKQMNCADFLVTQICVKKKDKSMTLNYTKEKYKFAVH